MKVILSRKGFDSGIGGYASPILLDGTLLSLPITIIIKEGADISVSRKCMESCYSKSEWKEYRTTYST